MLCLNLDIEALVKNIGRWETTWFNFHILHFKCLNLVGYDLKFGVRLYELRLGSSSFDKFTSKFYWSIFRFTFTIKFTSRLYGLCLQIKSWVELMG